MSLATGPKELGVGSRVGQYELREIIGEGGMGTVYRAVDTKLSKTVAVKVLTPSDGKPAMREHLKKRFLGEVLAVTRIEHENVVKVTDYGFVEDERPYLVMECLHGEDLGAYLRATKEPIAIDYAVDIILEVCAAIRACHRRGVVHRDLKPQNIFLATTDRGWGWQVKVLDFGVSKAPLTGDLTLNGQLLGTWQYLSPEQVNRKSGPESDQYAIGVLLYACLTKKRPFGHLQNVDLLKAIESGVFKSPRAHRPEIAEGLEQIILKAMSLSPAERFESVYALGQKLYDFASPLGRANWKTFYRHSPAQPPSPRQFAAGIPDAMLESLGETRKTTIDEKGPTANAHERTTVVNNEVDAGVGKSKADLLAPTKPPGPPSEVGTVPPSQPDDRSVDVHIEEGPIEAEDAAGRSDSMSAAMSGELSVQSGASTSLWVSEPAGESQNGDAPAETGTERIWRRRWLVAVAGGGLILAIGTLVAMFHRPEDRLIRPASPPSSARVDEQRSPSISPSRAPPAAMTLPIPATTSSERSVEAMGEQGGPDGTKATQESLSRKKRRRPHPREEETTPDGVLLVR